MQSAICTLFEGHYHFGLGALVNSLYSNGFRGIIWAGYRGELPNWVKPLKQCESFQEFNVAEGCVIRFVPVTAKIHFTNYKPNFMLELWEKYCLGADALFYFDPDIVVKCEWAFFERWAWGGIALCQDVNYLMPANHPNRLAWKSFAEKEGFICHRELDNFYNGGFVGMQKDFKSFLVLWETLLRRLSDSGASLTKFILNLNEYPYVKFDQDLMNLAAMITPHSLSTLGPEGMDFVPGGFTMSHATGSPKPWRKRMLSEALQGKSPSLADKGYWQNVQTPIRLYSQQELFWKRLDLRLGAAVGRFIRRA